mgnify:FL=1
MDKKKKIALILSILSVISATLVLIFYLQFKTKFTAVSPIAEVSPTPMPEELSDWIDPADFSFQYPKSLSLNPHDEDKVNYAHVELTSATHAGNLIVWVKDTSAETIENWVKQNKISNAIDSEVAGVLAKKVLTTGENNNITLSAINNGYLYQLEVNITDITSQTGNDFWNKVYSDVISTFKFISSSEKSTQQQSVTQDFTDQGSDEGVSEGEEVIE